MIITDEIRAKLLLHLPEAHLKKAAEKTGYSKSMVYKVLHEEQENDTIAECLISMAADTKKLKEQKQKKLSKIAEQL